MAYRKKYKPYILKYKALILKYVPYVFCRNKYLNHNNLFGCLQNVSKVLCVKKLSRILQFRGRKAP